MVSLSRMLQCSTSKWQLMLLSVALSFTSLLGLAKEAKAAVFPTGQAGEWKFDEVRNNVTPDSIGSAHGVLNGTVKPALAEGKINQSMSFSGDNSAYVGIPNILNPANTSFTLSAWVNVNASGGSSAKIIFQQEGSAGRDWIGIDSTGKFYSFRGGAAITAGVRAVDDQLQCYCRRQFDQLKSDGSLCGCSGRGYG